MNQFIGVEIYRDRKAKSITLKQKSYITALVEKHIASESIKAWKHQTPSGTSKEEVAKLMAIGQAKTDAEKCNMIAKGYLSILGALLWAACMTMPDLMFHSSHLARFMQSPSAEAYEAVLDLLRYAYCRRDIGITFGGVSKSPPVKINESDMPEVWADASFGGTVMPFGGGFIRWRNAAVCWISRKLKFVPLSTCEAEVAALVNVLMEAMFVIDILQDLGVELADKVPCFTDSKSGFDIIRQPGVTKHTAHFDRWLHWARELYLMQVIALYHTPTDLMMADDKNKMVDRTKFFKCRDFQLNAVTTVLK